MENYSKPLDKNDQSGFEFAKEMLNGDPTYAINFDRLMYSAKKNQFYIIEYLLCDEKQTVTPYTSHPNKYWGNKMKFIALWKAARALNATLYLVNYAKKGTKHEDEILLIEVESVTIDKLTGKNTKMTRKSFSDWFRALNKSCSSTPAELLK